MTDGISFVVPVHNGAATIRDTLEAIVADTAGRPRVEILVVEDASRDDSVALLQSLASSLPIRILAGAGRGAAAALNVGIREARFPLIAQVDQDVVIRPGWTQALCAELENPAVAAAQGCYVRDRGATLCVRAMSLDLELRYRAMGDGDTDHVCTGNTVYRASALHDIGLFDERLGYGYDNDASYRLQHAGYRLRLRHDAHSVHRWREGLDGYLRQQYGFGYGRVDVVTKHPSRFAGDRVSPALMMWHPIVLGLAAALLACAGAIAAAGGPWHRFAAAGGVLVTLLVAERAGAAARAYWCYRDAASLLFPALHLLRDLSWIAAVVVWSVRRASGRSPHPWHSMRPRIASR